MTITLAGEPVRAQGFDRIERERALSMLSNVKDQIKKNYYDPAFRGIDIDARFKVAEEKLKQASSLGQAFGIIAQAVLDLNDSHTIFSPPSRNVSVEYGWRMKAVGDQCFIATVKPEATPKRKDLSRGI